MLILLPPSETKREGGQAGGALDLGALSFPSLAAPRRAALSELRSLSTNLDAAVVALKLGPKGAPQAAKNRLVRTAPLLPALERFDGVLYDALGAGTLSEPARARAAEQVAVHSALFGLVGAFDLIPDYRLSHDSRLPGRSLKALWRTTVTAELERVPGVILDLRSEGYAALGPLPPREDALFVRVVAEGEDGRRRALNHFNKQGKGRFVRSFLESDADIGSVADLLDWAASSGIRLERGAPGELDLIV